MDNQISNLAPRTSHLVPREKSNLAPSYPRTFVPSTTRTSVPSKMMWAALLVVCNMVLPQVFHLIPQGGIIFAPLSLVILAGACKLGWRVGVLVAVASPLVNHFAFGLPQWGVLQVMMVKLVVLAFLGGWAAQRYQRVSIPLLAGIVMASLLVGGMAELLLTGGLAATVADFTIGWPGLLLQVFGCYAIMKIKI